jgi:ABC-2 type transport system permease protein
MNSAPASPEAREQLAAIAHLRWRIFVNSLRTLRGRLEMVSWIFVGFGFAVLGVGGMFGLAAAGWYFASHDTVEWLALPLWGVFLYWQLFPVMATAFTENFDSSNFLRFPLRYRSYFFIRMAYGALEPTTLIGTLWLIGMTAGIGIGAPRLLPWAVIALGAFWALNVLLARMIFAWIERWLARRKSREILGVVFFIFIISFQFIGPVMGRYGGRNRAATPEAGWAKLPGVMANLSPAQKLSPAGLAAGILADAARGNPGGALGSFALECVYSAAFLWLLDLRLRAQFRGENLSEAVAPVAPQAKKQAVRAGWGLPGLSGPVGALFEKEFRYLSRSGPMLFNLVMPIVILLIFRIGPANSARGGPFARHTDLAFPIGVAYALLILSNLTYNSFGVEGGGIQFLFVSPVRFREILVAKNLMQGAVLGLEIALVWAGVSLMFRPPGIGITLATLAGVLFAALVNFTVGDLLSLYAPKKFDFAVFGRQRAAGTTVFVSLGVQVVIVLLATLALLTGMHYGRIWIATIIFLALAAGAFGGYVAVLNRVDRIAISRRENLIAELCRAS